MVRIMTNAERYKVEIRCNRVYADGACFAELVPGAEWRLRVLSEYDVSITTTLPPEMADCYGRALMLAAEECVARNGTDRRRR